MGGAIQLKTIYVDYVNGQGDAKTIAVRAFDDADAIARLEDFAAGGVVAGPERAVEPDEENDSEA